MRGSHKLMVTFHSCDPFAETLLYAQGLLDNKLRLRLLPHDSRRILLGQVLLCPERALQLLHHDGNLGLDAPALVKVGCLRSVCEQFGGVVLRGELFEGRGMGLVIGFGGLALTSNLSASCAGNAELLFGPLEVALALELHRGGFDDRTMTGSDRFSFDLLHGL